MANNQDKRNLVPKGSPKQNYQLWIILTLVVLIVSVFYFNKSNAVIEISENRFEKMALRAMTLRRLSISEIKIT